MNPNRRRVRRTGARPTYTAPRPSYSRGAGARPAAKRTLPSLPRLSLRQIPSLPIIRIRWLSLTLLIIVVVVVVTLIGHATALKQVKVSGNRSLTTAHITQLSQDGLGRQWFGHNTALVDTGSLANYLKQADPAIQQVQVERSGLHTLTVKVSERQPTLNWKTAGTTYLLDANATVIGPTASAYAGLPTVTDSSNLPAKTGERVAPTQFVTFCSQLAQLLPTTNYKAAAFTVPTSTSEVYVTTSTSITLKFDTTRPAGEEIADLKSVQTQLTALHQSPSQYIDLRIPHKAYYK